jgi:hypothetical protein
VARAALWLGLWPKLDALYRRACFLFHFDDQEVAREIAHILEEEVAGMCFEGPRPVQKVFGTLLGNVDRELTDRLKEKTAEAAELRRHDPSHLAEREGEESPLPAVPPPAERSREEKTEELFRRITPIVGERGAGLIWRRYYENEEIPREEGAARVALHRALAALRKAAEEDPALRRWLEDILT